MGGSMWFISILRDHPLIGLLIGLVFFIFMFASKNLVVYLYSRHREKNKNLGHGDNANKESSE